jgi:hypothetical protein
MTLIKIKSKNEKIIAALEASQGVIVATRKEQEEMADRTVTAVDVGWFEI